ncbi:hypothetical protein BDR06DRAFT_1021540 [Suillus hirtellus]|nr:hypothetical protein BDR06DRAFT_1021540 [Suillus hirtellus]
MPYRGIGVKQATPITGILHLLGGQQLITYSQGHGEQVLDGGALPDLEGFRMMKFDTATWTVLDERGRTVQLWNIKTNQPIGTPLHHEHTVYSGKFSADGKFLFTKCQDKDEAHTAILDNEESHYDKPDEA